MTPRERVRVEVVIRDSSTKTCPTCQEEKPLSAYSSQISTLKGGVKKRYFVSECKPCRASRYRKFYKPLKVTNG